MLVGKLTYDTLLKRKTPTGYLSSEISDFLFSKNDIKRERPLKNNLQDLSFKGLSFEGKKKKEDKLTPLLATFGVIAGTGLALRLAPAYKKAGNYNINEFFEFIKNKSGIDHTVVENLFNHVKNSEFAKKMVTVQGDRVFFSKKTVPQLIWDGLIYPFKILPGDILNGVVELLGKVKPLNDWAKRTLNKPVFKNIRQRSKVDAQINSLRGLFEMSEKLKGKSDSDIASRMFRQSVKMFDEKTGNYDTKHERSLNRLVSGLPPAIFLANDAYNLSRMMDDDPDAAKKEQKIRFRQETARIGFNAYITLITLGALQKYINNSPFGIFMMTGATTLVTEAFSRLINGKHITRLTPKEARAENKKNNAVEAQIKPETSFKASENKSNDKQQKPLLSFDTVMKASAVVIAGGFGVKGLRKIPSVEKQWKAFTGFFKGHYNKLTSISDFKIPKKELDLITETLKKHGFTDLAEKYQDVAINSLDKGFIHLGSKDKKIKPFVNFVIAPFKFAWNTVTLPYNLVMKVVNVFEKKSNNLSFAISDKQTLKEIMRNYSVERNIKPEKLETFVDKVIKGKISKNAKLENYEQELVNRISDVSSLAKSIENIGRKAKQKNLSPKEFKSYVNDNILKAFNVDTMSNISNSELSNLAKTAATIATIWFLMTDNYNMVMLKSNGNDVEGAKTKFTERFVQEGSRLFYQTLLIDLFNSTFRSQYNKSLFGMSWITLTNTTLGEWLTRASVGVPVGTHNRDGLIALENKQENATGFKKAYFNFMKRLTGKRLIKSYEVKPQIAKPVENLNFTNRTVFNEMGLSPHAL